MFRITKQADYGIVLMTYFARDEERSVHNARDLADRARLPQPTVTKILKVLARQGLLISQRGVKGGYQLAGEPREITVGRIITALEGPIAIAQCCENGGGCEKDDHCPVAGNWQIIDNVIRQALESITLADMAQPLRAKQLPRLGASVTAAAVNATTGDLTGCTGRGELAAGDESVA
ncbi:MAG: SUF system Fe-S cluster assembly regulator [Myxococcales bacterium]|nr:SUF system Fe-S cluster assembly regulator [Myxococcales bacterium]